MLHRFRILIVGTFVFLIPISPIPEPVPSGITLGGPCGPTTIADEAPPHSEQGQRLD